MGCFCRNGPPVVVIRDPVRRPLASDMGKGSRIQKFGDFFLEGLVALRETYLLAWMAGALRVVWGFLGAFLYLGNELRFRR